MYTFDPAAMLARLEIVTVVPEIETSAAVVVPPLPGISSTLRVPPEDPVTVNVCFDVPYSTLPLDEDNVTYPDALLILTLIALEVTV